jgi:hypothetical protein
MSTAGIIKSGRRRAGKWIIELILLRGGLGAVMAPALMVTSMKTRRTLTPPHMLGNAL